MDRRGASGLGALLIALLVVPACGTSSVARSSPPASSTAQFSPVASSGVTAPASTPASPSATAPTDLRLVIFDPADSQVRLARLDATDTATTAGQFDGVVAGQAIVINGTSLMAMTAGGSVRTLGHLAAAPEYTGAGSVAVNPTLTQWVYTVWDTSGNSAVHLGSPSGDQVLATLPSPDGNAYYESFAWNAAGVYMVQEATGLGGVGPFLEYHFPLGTLDLSSGKVALASPPCVADSVLDDGTLLCQNRTGGLEVRSPSGATHVIQLSTGTSAGEGVFSRLTLSPDQNRIVAARNGSSNPNLINYQMVVADLSSSSSSAWGPADFYPDTWLPDGRLVADHLCWTFQQNGGPCDPSLDGTYILSANGNTKTLFYKLVHGSVVGWVG